MPMKSLLRSGPMLLLACALAMGCDTCLAVGCTVNATGLAFGSIDPLIAAAATSSSTITVSCTTLTSYSIALSAGSGGSFVQRMMQSGANQLAYQIYLDAAYGTVWGDGSGESAIVNASATGAGTTSFAYGRVPHQQSAFAGTYADTIVVSITY